MSRESEKCEFLESSLIMKLQICILILIVLFVECKIVSNENPISNNQREVLAKTDDFLILGHLENGLLNDTLEYYRKGKLRLVQVWENGKLKSNSTNNKKKLEKIYDLDLMKFYDSIKILPDTIFKEDEPTVFRILNVPSPIVGMSVTGGIARIENGNFVITPSVFNFINIQLWYNGLFHTEFKKYKNKRLNNAY